MKILITGANGMLGSDLQEVLVDYDVIATGSKDLDISDYEVVMNKFSEFEPDFVIGLYSKPFWNYIYDVAFNVIK